MNHTDSRRILQNYLYLMLKNTAFSVLIGSHRVLLAVTLAVLTVLLRCEDGRYRVSGH